MKCLMLLLSVIFLMTSCGTQQEKKDPQESKVAVESAMKQKKTIEPASKAESLSYQSIDKVKTQIQKYAPVKIEADLSILDENEKKTLELIVKAAEYMDKLFLRQVYSKNEGILKTLLTNANPDYSILLQYFKINFGPFDRLEKDVPFIGDKPKPAGANFYEKGITKEALTDWIKANPDKEKEITSNFTLIQKSDDGFKAVPYSVAYKDLLVPAAELLKKAAQTAGNPSLKKYLNSRAEAFLSNDYYQSDIDWMDLKDHKIEVVIGPYEVYEDALFGYKAAFEAFVTIVDPVESKKLQIVGNYLDEMEKYLPIDDKHKNFNRGSSSPVKVVNEVFTAGDTKAGIQTLAFNLPNDERVRESKGSKKVMLKNIARAKFEKTWTPIAKEAISSGTLKKVSFDAYFNHILLHEFAHGLGPGVIMKEGKKTTVNKELKELYSTIEEAKADILGVWNLRFLIDKGVFPAALKDQVYETFLGGIFRSVRFGTNAAHGGANVIALNYLTEKGGFGFDPDKKVYFVVYDKIEDAVKQLAHEVLMIQAKGDYQAAKALISKYRIVSDSLKAVLEKVKHVPVDIFPIYSIEEKSK